MIFVHRNDLVGMQTLVLETQAWTAAERMRVLTEGEGKGGRTSVRGNAFIDICIEVKT